jgi:ATP-dependent Lhr-like helicase
MWSMIYPELLSLVREHRSTIVFVNSRSLAERVAQRLNELASEDLARAHHGSVSHARRNEIEEALKQGRLKAIVATSSLELGIDMGSVDLVILVESPGSVSRGLQRVGRAGHGVDETSRGVVFPKFQGDLVECAVVAERMLAGRIEAVRIPENPLDVLAQQLVAICCADERPTRVDTLGALIRRAAPYRDLSREAFVSVLEMLAGQYPSHDFQGLRPRLSWDRARDVLSARKGSKMLAILNGGTIPDRGLYTVHAGEGGPRVGELDEEMVNETRPGDTFILGASTWRALSITRDRVIVSPAPGEPGRMPFWRGDGPGRPIELGNAVGAFLRRIGELSEADAVTELRASETLDEDAARNLARYVHDQKAHAGCVPTDCDIVIERFRDEIGDWRISILTPFGSRVHAPWALAVQALLSHRAGYQVETMYTDDGIVLRFPDAEKLPASEALVPRAAEVEEVVAEEVGNSSLFASTFRECAARSLLLPRQRPDRRTPLWQQRFRAKELLATVRGYPKFPILLETYRHCLKDVFDLPALRRVLDRIESGDIRVHDVETPSASPFARSLSFAYVANYLYEQDAPLAERKAQALTLDRNLLRELLGQEELRELIDATVLAELETELDGSADGFRARSADELEDRLRRNGELDRNELRLRSTEDPERWLRTLRDEERIIDIELNGRVFTIIASDAGRYRGAFGVTLPDGLPTRFLEPHDAPLQGLILRYARSHGPFRSIALSERWGVPEQTLIRELLALKNRELLIRGEIRPLGTEPEWCEPGVMRRLKRRTLAKLRSQVAPVEPELFAYFLAEWQGLETKTDARGLETLEQAIIQLEGLPLAWSSLVEGILPARVSDFRVEMLDMLSASGDLVWVGKGALGATDGRIALYRRDRAPLFVEHSGEMDAKRDGVSNVSAAKLVLDRLAKRGASFTLELMPTSAERDGKLDSSMLETTLRELMWAGLITNDTFFPLRNLGRRSKRAGHRRGRLRSPTLTGSGSARGSRSAREMASLSGGRWSLVSELARPRSTPAPSDTERLHAFAEILLNRYGIVSRSVVTAERSRFSYSNLYPVLREMEERGRVRRGYFVDGLSGSQFAMPGAVERLRSTRDMALAAAHPGDVRVLLSVEPANPYGALLSWPEGASERRRPRRAPGAFVVLYRGRLAAYLEKGARTLLTFPALSEPGVLTVAIHALRTLPQRRGRALRIDWIDDHAAVESPLEASLRAAGFFSDFKSMVSSPLLGASDAGPSLSRRRSSQEPHVRDDEEGSGSSGAGRRF